MGSSDNDGVQLTKGKKILLADLQIVRYGDNNVNENHNSKLTIPFLLRESF